MRPQSRGLLLLLITLSYSCHQASRDTANTGKQTGVPASIAGKAMGIYSGNFNKGLITLELNYISGKNVSGYDVHKGLRRNINGRVSLNGGQLDFVLKEPGDNPYDGAFYLSLDTASLKMKGKWVPVDSTRTAAKILALSRQADTAYMELDEWTSSGGGDTSLNFNNNGTCELSFYERPQDSTSLLLTVRGNYEKKADTFKIEWQKNSHTPVQTMKLVKAHVKQKTDGGDDYDIVYLRGNGLEFIIREGD